MLQEVRHLIYCPNVTGKPTLVENSELSKKINSLNANDIVFEIGTKDCKPRDKKQVILIAGPNGTGKTRYVEQEGIHRKMDFLNADDIAVEIGAKDCKSAGRVWTKRIHDHLDAGISFAFESTIAGKTHPSILRMAGSMGYEIKFIYIFNRKVEDNLERVKQRVEEHKGHNVPKEDIIYRFGKSLEHFNETAELANIWEVFYTEAPSVYEPVAKSEYGNVLVQNPAIYDLFRQMTRGILK